MKLKLQYSFWQLQCLLRRRKLCFIFRECTDPAVFLPDILKSTIRKTILNNDITSPTKGSQEDLRLERIIEIFPPIFGIHIAIMPNRRKCRYTNNRLNVIKRYVYIKKISDEEIWLSARFERAGS